MPAGRGVLQRLPKVSGHIVRTSLRASHTYDDSSHFTLRMRNYNRGRCQPVTSTPSMGPLTCDKHNFLLLPLLIGSRGPGGKTRTLRSPNTGPACCIRRRTVPKEQG